MSKYTPEQRARRREARKRYDAKQKRHWNLDAMGRASRDLVLDWRSLAWAGCHSSYHRDCANRLVAAGLVFG